VSTSGTSTPSSNMSTAQSTRNSPRCSCCSEVARGALAGPACTATAAIPAPRKTAAMKSARLGARQGRLDNHTRLADIAHTAPARVGDDPVILDARDGVIGKEPLETRADLGEALRIIARDDPIIPFDGVGEGRCRNIGTAHERMARARAVAVREEDIALEVEPDALRQMDAQIEIAGEIQQTAQRGRVGHAEIITDENARLTTASEKLAKMLDDQPRAAVEQEGDSDVAALRAIERREQMRQQSIGTTGHEARSCHVRFDASLRRFTAAPLSPHPRPRVAHQRLGIAARAGLGGEGRDIRIHVHGRALVRSA